MTQYTNAADISLAVAVFLASDFYDYVDEPNTISVTTLMKPLRQIILSGRVPQEDAHIDLMSMSASRIGTAIHDGFEKAWITNYANAMRALGHPESLINKIRVNPPKTENLAGCIPVYLEQRATKQVGKWNVTGKFDFVGNGTVQDIKSTSTFTFTNQTNKDKYPLQGGLYRWLNPEIITEDYMSIHYIFTDWKAVQAKTDPNYPQQRIISQTYALKSVEEIDMWVKRKLRQIEHYIDAPEDQIPDCDDAELWRSEPQYKYYKNPDKQARSTKNFDTYQAAMLRLVEDGGTGIVKTVPGQVTACKYCSAFPVCTQKDRLILSGDLQLT